MLILDTDHISEYVRGGSPGKRLEQRLAAVTDDASLTIVTIEEVHRGWLAKIRKARTPHSRLEAYTRYYKTVEALRRWPLLAWDRRAEALMERWAQSRLGIGTMDIRIAAIAQAHGHTLLSRNLRDFERVPDLKVENWLD
jgi:tRNA(fMet)-specific endonuclease VapC